MGSTGYIKCPLCFDRHKIDKYDWIQTCRGYMPMFDFRELIYLERGEII